MTDVQRLLDALAMSCGDGTLWLALADALEEEGDPERAELVRLTIGLHRQPCGEDWRAWEARHAGDLRRSRELLSRGVRPCVPQVVNSLGMRFAMIPAGTFWMGSPDEEARRSEDEGPRHEVEITRAFYLGVYAVTQGEYERVMGRNPSNLEHGERHPVEQVSWEEAVEFCRRLGELPREKSEGRVYRLPSEAEWEYACRGPGGSSEPFHFGKSLKSARMKFAGERPGVGGPQGEDRQRVVTAEELAPNGWGLRQMHGNVWEWCADWYDAGEYARSTRKDPSGPSRGSNRVVRGGSWSRSEGRCRAAYRNWCCPAGSNSSLGFRVALVSSRG